jgi:hypothetical protein
MRVGGLWAGASKAVRRDWTQGAKKKKGPKRLAVAVGALRKSAKIR